MTPKYAISLIDNPEVPQGILRVRNGDMSLDVVGPPTADNVEYIYAFLSMLDPGLSDITFEVNPNDRKRIFL